MAAKKELDPLFESELTRLYEARDIAGLRTLLLRPNDPIMVHNQLVPKICIACLENNVEALKLMLVHPDMTSEYLLSKYPLEADGYVSEYIGAPITECMCGNSLESLELLLASPFITRAALGKSNLSLYPIEFADKETLECLKCILSHRLFTPSTLDKGHRGISSLCHLIEENNIDIIQEIFDRYDDSTIEARITEDVIDTLCTCFEWNDACELVKNRVYHMKALDRIITPEMWCKMDVGWLKDKDSVAKTITCPFFPRTWKDARKCDGRFNMAVKLILGPDSMHSARVKKYIIDNIAPIIKVCFMRCTRSRALKLIKYASIAFPAGIQTIRVDNGYNLFQWYCSVLKSQNFHKTFGDRLHILLKAGICPNELTSDGLTYVELLTNMEVSSHTISQIGEICKEYSGEFTKRAV
jgi:hypothetical protein